MIRLLIILLSITLNYSLIAQSFLWYENQSELENIQYTNSLLGTFVPEVGNPETSGINSNSIVSKFEREESRGSFIYFNLYDPITDITDFNISLKAYIDLPTEELNGTSDRLRIYFSNTVVGKTITRQLKFTEGKKWQEFNFIFDGEEISTEVLAAGGYNQMQIGFANGSVTQPGVDYYFDQIYGDTEQVVPVPTLTNADWLQGSWGVRHIVDGGISLDEVVDEGYDYVQGALDIVENFPSAGHVITNCTHPASGYRYTLRDNPNVDIANEIHPDFVPSLENEQIILEVIDIFKNANKKVILYLNGAGPALRSGEEHLAAWNLYVDSTFNGNEHLAWMNLCEGYIKRFKGLADGYWVDAFSSYPGDENQRAEFIEMIRNVDPTLAITANRDKSYFRNDDGIKIQVESDALIEEDERNYDIIKYESNDAYSDFTSGHITPLASGAPSNSWAYEEFTIPDIVDSGLSLSSDGRRLVVKHMFTPIREKWTGNRGELRFTDIQALRFVKNITEAGGSITFSTTNDMGIPMPDEIEVLSFVDQEMTKPSNNSYPYIRPEGAFLVGENPDYIWYEDQTDTENIEYTTTEMGTFITDQVNPNIAGLNTNNIVSKFEREEGEGAFLHFKLPNSITDLENYQIKLKAYIDLPTGELNDNYDQLRVYLTSSTEGETIYKQLEFDEGQTWEEFTFDFNDVKISDDLFDAGGYDELYIGFANDSIAQAAVSYYIDSFYGSTYQGGPIDNNVDSLLPTKEDSLFARVLLEGYYDAETEEMHTQLQDKGLLPLNQPFNTSPWNYTGTESTTTLPINAVDWVLLILREADGTITNQAAGFIDKAGNLLSVEGIEGIPITGAENQYFSIHTRSHLAILSAKQYTGDLYDFTMAGTQAQGTEQLKLASGKYFLYAGDYDGSGIINNLDFNNWKVQSAKLNEYLPIDGDGNGIINSLDYNLWIINRSKIGEQGIRY